MKSSLIVIFNQDFSKNIPKLEKLYSGRFNQIRYLVPTTHARLTQHQYRSGKVPVSVLMGLDRIYALYRKWFGKQASFSLLNTSSLLDFEERVHQVVGDQYLFYDYIYQAADHILDDESDWFWFTGDDAVLGNSLNQESILAAFEAALPSEVDSIVCKPVISKDSWLDQLQGSVEKASKIVSNMLSTDTPYKDKLHIKKEDLNSSNETVCVACADFFGVRRDVLERCIPLFRQAAKQRLFVEIAVPNIIFSQSKFPHTFSNFTWILQPSEAEIKNMISSLNDDGTIFVHPLKLSSVDLDT